MTRRGLPPLQFLQAFEAAGRLLSFKRAAEELHVTPSAISQQIRSLEEALGFALFERLVRGLRLTAAGEIYWQDVNEALNHLRWSFAKMGDCFGRTVIRVKIIPFIANEVVIPALDTFQEQHPHIELSIETSPNTNNIEEEDIDMAVCVGQGKWNGFSCEKLRDIIVTPVCSPTHAGKANWKSLTDLSGETFIKVSTNPDHWLVMAEAVGIKPLAPRNELVFDSYYAAMSAAERGLGVALGFFPLTTSWVAAGRLVAPFTDRVRVPEAHYVLCRNTFAKREACQAFSAWMYDQFSQLVPLEELPGEL